MTNIRSRRSFVSTLSKTLPRQSEGLREPERRSYRLWARSWFEVQTRRWWCSDRQTLPLTSALKLSFFLSVGPERWIILSGSRLHWCSPPLCLKDVCRGIKQQMSISVLLHMHPASPFSTQQIPVVLWSACCGPVRRRPFQHREAMRNCRDLHDCTQHDSAKAKWVSWKLWGLRLVRDHLSDQTSSFSWARSAICCLQSELQITAWLH